MRAPTQDNVVSVHAKEASSLWNTRSTLKRMPHVNLHALGRLDGRLIAHLDGLAVAVAGDEARPFLDSGLEEPSGGAAFALAVAAIQAGQTKLLDRLWPHAAQSQAIRAGLSSAFGWVEPIHLRGVVRELLQSEDSAKILVGLTACAMHRTDPGLEHGPWLSHTDPLILARAMRTAGELGLTALAPRCIAALRDENEACRFRAAWSAVLLGRSDSALIELTAFATAPGGASRERAFRLSLQAMDVESGHAFLQQLRADLAQRLWLIRGCGIAGDAAYVPWLIAQMSDPVTARAAGEAFTLITGADLDALQLWQQRPENVETGPTDDPADENVDLDADEGLMWPDQKKVEAWWASNGSRFHPGRRYFLGHAVARDHCIQVLKNGYQRQRILAAHYLCLLSPGTPLFNTSAPAWRQQRLLSNMS